MRAFKWILLVAILGLWGTGTVWAEEAKEEAVEERDDEDAIYWTRGIDPSAARWDLRDDPIAHYRNQIALSREL